MQEMLGHHDFSHHEYVNSMTDTITQDISPPQQREEEQQYEK